MLTISKLIVFGVGRWIATN